MRKQSFIDHVFRFSFLADRMRDGTEDDEENIKSSAGSWKKEDSAQTRSKFGLPRRGASTNTGSIQGGHTPSKGDEGWGRPNVAQSNGRTANAGTSREPFQHSTQINYSQSSSARTTQNEGGSRYLVKKNT